MSSRYFRKQMIPLIHERQIEVCEQIAKEKLKNKDMKYLYVTDDGTFYKSYNAPQVIIDEIKADTGAVLIDVRQGAYMNSQGEWEPLEDLCDSEVIERFKSYGVDLRE